MSISLVVVGVLFGSEADAQEIGTPHVCTSESVEACGNVLVAVTTDGELVERRTLGRAYALGPVRPDALHPEDPDFGELASREEVGLWIVQGPDLVAAWRERASAELMEAAPLTMVFDFLDQEAEWDFIASSDTGSASSLAQGLSEVTSTVVLGVAGQRVYALAPVPSPFFLVESDCPAGFAGEIANAHGRTYRSDLGLYDMPVYAEVILAGDSFIGAANVRVVDVSPLAAGPTVYTYELTRAVALGTPDACL